MGSQNRNEFHPTKLVLPPGFGEKRTVPSVVRVAIHHSQFPENVRRSLIESLRRRQVNHKFHYDSLRQTRKWLALHEAFSPARNEADVPALYDRSFAAAARRAQAGPVHVIGLGCGGGWKDTRLLRILKAAGRKPFYTPCDVSVAMTLVARKTALGVVPEGRCFPLVCDLASADDLPAILESHGPPEAPRIITFFGMLPNFESSVILPRLASIVRRQDLLLAGANLAPGRNYDRGMKRILPQYDNSLTRDWLITFLLDLGVEREDGEIQFHIEDDPAGAPLKRVVAEFRFSRERTIRVEAGRFTFRPGESVRLFFSYRHRPQQVRRLLRLHELHVMEQWVAASQEEGVFLCRRTPARRRAARTVNKSSSPPAPP
jgi:uncharacterized SAM-dependent methyltransferase